MSEPEKPAPPPPFDTDDPGWNDAPAFYAPGREEEEEEAAKAAAFAKWAGLAEPTPADARRRLTPAESAEVVGVTLDPVAAGIGRIAAEREKLRAEEEQAAAPAYDVATEAPLLGDFLPDAWAAMGRRARGEDTPAPLPWNGIAERMGGGLWPGLYVLSGGTGTGKTQWALQAALHAALEGWPVLYCGLELDREGIVARLAAMLARRQWSDLYLGRDAKNMVNPSPRARERAEWALKDVMLRHGETLAKLPFRLDMGSPFGWSYDRLAAGVKGMAEAHPGKRPVVVLDFLQLVTSPEPTKDGTYTQREDLRERIGRAAYAGRQAARDHGAAVLLLSATARGNYGELNFRAKDTPWPKEGEGPYKEVIQTMGDKPKPLPFPGELVGLGKESGEIEYAADYVLALAAEWPRRKDEPMIKKAPGKALDQAEKGPPWGLSTEKHLCKWRPVHVATAKTRAGAGAGWDVLGFNGSWFGELDPGDREALHAWRAPPPRAEEAPPGEGSEAATSKPPKKPGGGGSTPPPPPAGME